MRTLDPQLIKQAVSFFLKDDIDQFDPVEWVANHSNIALVNDRDDLAVFEGASRPGIVTGHYYFQSRGRQAVHSGREFLVELFRDYPVELCRGLTPLTNLGARWMSRHLGFTSHGVLSTPKGPHELFMLSRKDLNVQHLRLSEPEQSI